MYTVHTYTDSNHEYRWGTVAENGNKVAEPGEGYANSADMEQVLTRLFVPARGAFSGVHVPWVDCDLHASKSGKCYLHQIVDARTLAQSLQEAGHAPSPHDP